VNEDNIICDNAGEEGLPEGTITELTYFNARNLGTVSMTTTGTDSIYYYDYPCDLNRSNGVDLTDRDMLRDDLRALGLNLKGAVVP
jgi:hypothetical protein